jgi:beta-mannosidase
MEEGWRHWGWARAYDTPEDSARVREAYDAIFHGVLPEVVSREDPTRGYWPSSPSVGWGSPESLIRGDAHYWGVWHGREPFRVFAEKLPRFMSEFGFQAFPPMSTVRAFTAPGDRSLFHPVLLVHQKHPIGNELIREYMTRDYPLPSGLDDFVYVSQLLQARGMRTAFEAHRRARPRTMGTLYWQLNDTWPVVSWSGRDYFGRWKALHWAAREAFSPVLVSPRIHGDSVEVWGVSDLLERGEGTLRLSLLDFTGTELWHVPVPVSLPPASATLLWKGSTDDLLAGVDARKVVLVASLEEAPRRRSDPSPEGVTSEGPAEEAAAAALPEIPEAFLYFHPPKELDLATPTILVTATPARDEGGVLLTLRSDALAKDVYLTLDAGEAHRRHHFRDNFFDLLPGRPRTVHLATHLGPTEVKSRLRIRTLAEVPREGEAVAPSR